MRNLNLAQRVVLVVALGAVCVAIDGFVLSRPTGWFAYARNTGELSVAYGGGSSKVLGVRFALTLAWATSSIFLFRSPR